MLDIACAMKLGAWAFTSLAAVLHANEFEFASLLAEVGDRSIEAGHALKERPRDVVRKAAARLAHQIERRHREWLLHEFGSDPSGQAEMAGLLAALPDVLAETLPDRLAVANASLDARAIASQAVAKAATYDERFRQGMFGAKLLHCLIVGAYEAAREDKEFAATMRLAIDQVLLERSAAAAGVLQRIEAGQTRIEALIQAGGAHINLSRRHLRRAPPHDLRELLMTELRATDLVGRQDILVPLKAWLAMSADHDDVSVHLLTGEAGAGKTRLAIELCEWAEQANWAAGFVRQEELARFHDQHHPAEWRWPKPTLLIVDYAAASARVLSPWLDELASAEPDATRPPLRILLLERYASRDTGWWADLLRPGSRSGPGADSLIAVGAPLPLGPLRSADERRALLSQATQLAARVLGKAPLELPAPGVDGLFDQRLASDAIETEPLFLLMAGVVAAESGAPAALAMGRLDLAEWVANAECRRMERLARAAGANESLVLHLAACATLQNGCDTAEAARMIAAEREALGDRSGSRSDELLSVLAGALAPPQGDGIDAVRPDLIGESLMLRALLPPRNQMASVERAFHRAGTSVIGTVIRTAQDYALGEVFHTSVSWLDQLSHLTDDPFALMAIAAELPEETLALRERAAEIEQRICTGLNAVGGEDRNIRPLLAGHLNNLAVRLSGLGEREAALAAAREAGDLYRALAAQRPDAFQPNLATSLNNLANMLSGLGEREAAPAAAREAVDLYRALAAQRPDAFRPDLAMSLNNLANRLSELGEREAALAAAREAVDIRRTLAAQRPDAFRPDLATSLNNLAAMLSDLGEREAALAAAREAVDIRRTLAAQRPDAFRPNLATSLNNLANMLSGLGEREAALTAAREAADLYRALAVQRPDAFRPDLAMSLNNLANRLSELGEREAALAASRESADIRRALAAQRPDTFRPNLATSLNNLAAMLSDLGEREAALAAAREAVDIRRTLAAQRPYTFRPDLAMSLSNQAAMLSDLGEREAALAAAREAVDLYRGLAAQRPDAFRPDLAGSLNNLANMLSDLGECEAALAAAREASDLYRVLSAQRPDAFRPNLATSLSVLADCLEAVGQPKEAVEADVEAIKTLTELFSRHKAAFARLIEQMCRDYIRRCEALGQTPDDTLLAPVAAGLQALQASTLDPASPA